MVSFNSIPPFSTSLPLYNHSMDIDQKTPQETSTLTHQPLHIGLYNPLNLCWLNSALKFAAATEILDTYLKVDVEKLIETQCLNRQIICDKIITEEITNQDGHRDKNSIIEKELFQCQKFIEETTAKKDLLISIQTLLSQALTIIRHPTTPYFPPNLQMQLVNALQPLCKEVDFSLRQFDSAEFLQLVDSTFSLECSNFPMISMEINYQEYDLTKLSESHREILSIRPQTLDIHLPRRHYSGEGENVSVHFINAKVLPENGPVQLKPRNIEFPTNKTRFTYKLHPFYQVSSAIVHIGDSNNMEGGHYTFIERKMNEDGTYQYYWHNDMNILKISKENFEQFLQAAVLLHLEKTIHAPTVKTKTIAEKKLPKATSSSTINMRQLAQERLEKAKKTASGSSSTPSPALPAELDQRQKKTQNASDLPNNIRTWSQISGGSTTSSSIATAMQPSSSSVLTIQTETETKQRLIHILKTKRPLTNTFHIGTTQFIISERDRIDLYKDPFAIIHLQRLAGENPGATISIGLPPLENADNLFRQDPSPEKHLQNLNDLAHGLAMERLEDLQQLRQTVQSEIPDNIQLSEDELNADDAELKRAIETLPPNEASVLMNLTPPPADRMPIYTAEDASGLVGNPYQTAVSNALTPMQARPVDELWLSEYFGDRWETVKAESSNSSTVYSRPKVPTYK